MVMVDMTIDLTDMAMVTDMEADIISSQRKSSPNSPIGRSQIICSRLHG
jgi:hypothetical protein